MAVVWCHFCKESSHYMDDVDWDFTCKHCGKRQTGRPQPQIDWRD